MFSTIYLVVSLASYYHITNDVFKIYGLICKVTNDPNIVKKIFTLIRYINKEILQK